MFRFIFTLAALAFLSGSAQASTFESIYQKISDEKTCAKTEEAEGEDGPGFIEYVCNGPVEGISITYLTGGDWDNISLTVGDNTYGFWEQISATGAFSGFGNPNGIVEWVGKKSAQGYIDPIALIIRLSGTQLDADGNGEYVSQLAVYGINGDAVCFKGFAKGKDENVKARKLAQTGACLEQLVPQAE